MTNVHSASSANHDLWLGARRLPPRAINSCAVQTAGGRQWVSYEDVALDSGDFDRLGADFAASAVTLRSGPVGMTEAHLFDLREASAFALGWLQRRRRCR